MKKILLSLIILLVLCSCIKKQEEETSSIDEYVENMDAYEIFEIAFLGVLNSKRNIEDIIDRIKDYDELKIAKDLIDNNQIYGESKENTNVYLIIPNKDVDITVGKYNCLDDSLENIDYKAEDCKPFIYYEEIENSLNPSSIIEFVKGNEYGNLLLGFSLDYSKLRTAFKMGIVDTTPYEIFTSAEIPSYDQAFFDVLTSIDEVNLYLDNGMELKKMSEMNYQGKYYAVYYIDDDNVTVKCYAVNYGPNSLSVLESLDFTDWIEILKY